MWPTSFLFSPFLVYLQWSALHMIKFKYSTVRHGIFTNSRLHHLQCYKQTQNITQWLESTVVPFQCLFIVRQDTAELFNSCHWGVKQVVRLPCQWSYRKWTPLLLSVLWFGRCKVAQRSTGWSREAEEKRKRGSVVCYMLSSELSLSGFGRTMFHSGMAKVTTRAGYMD